LSVVIGSCSESESVLAPLGVSIVQSDLRCGKDGDLGRKRSGRGTGLFNQQRNGAKIGSRLVGCSSMPC
jgi:hypothetical protein